MIDFINKGNNRKVNFIILPSLESNGSFLENGKSWVFTYVNDTFRFEDSDLQDLNELHKEIIQKKTVMKPIYIKKLKTTLYAIDRSKVIPNDIKNDDSSHSKDNNNTTKLQRTSHNDTRTHNNNKYNKRVLNNGHNFISSKKK